MDTSGHQNDTTHPDLEVHIVGMVSPEAEHVPFTIPIDPEEGDRKGHAEIWLQVCSPCPPTAAIPLMTHVLLMPSH